MMKPRLLSILWLKFQRLFGFIFDFKVLKTSLPTATQRQTASKVVFLRLGQGDLQHGFPSVEIRLEAGGKLIAQKTGCLPAAAALAHRFTAWQFLYEAFYDQQRYRLRGVDINALKATPAGIDEPDEIEFETTGITGFSEQKFRTIAQAINAEMQTWLNAPGLLEINNLLRTKLQEEEEIRVIIETPDPDLQRLPWHCWQFFVDYSYAEPSFSAPEFEQRRVRSQRRKPRILAVLGNRDGIDSAAEEAFLQRLKAEATFLPEPSLQALTEALRHPKGWDIFFFAGHSSSQTDGQFFLNATETVTINDLQYALQKAIAEGLKLAIFNSCDGSKLAQALQGLNLPTVIVMKEPVPNQVAQDFLRSFLQSFAAGASLPTAVREARESLQGNEREFPCASWLPGIWQNPAAPSPLWHDFEEDPPAPKRLRWQTVLATSLVVTGLVIGARSLGWLNFPERWAYDRLMQVQPSLPPDPRILLVTVNDDDIKTFRKPLNDAMAHQLLTTLEQYQPRVIGLDIFRDEAIEPGRAKLLPLLQTSPHIISVCSIGEETRSPRIRQPEGVPADKLGFADALMHDDDNAIRRYSFAMTPGGKDCPTEESLALRVVRRYLPTNTSFKLDKSLSIDSTRIPILEAGVAGYQQASDIGLGWQVLLRFNRSHQIAEEVSLSTILANPEAQFIRDRIILIGYCASRKNSQDIHSTAVGEMCGVRIHAHAVSQLLNAVNDDHTFIDPRAAVVEMIWISSWAMIGGFLGWWFLSLRRFGFAQSLVFSALLLSCFLFLCQSIWVPIIPAILALLLTAQVVRIMQQRSPKLKLRSQRGNANAKDM